MDPVIAGLVVPLAGALIALVAGLIGVVVGGRMARKTTREQLAAQDRRDALLWAREDRHRFTADKRIAYARFLNLSLQGALMAERWIGQIPSEISEAAAQYPDLLPGDLHKHVIDTSQYQSKLDEVTTERRDLLAQIQLIGPEEVTSRAAALNHRLESTFWSLVTTWALDDASEHLTATSIGYRELRAAMRADLSMAREPDP